MQNTAGEENVGTAASYNKGEHSRYGDKHIHQLYNPFSVHNNAPKWPDGLADFSIGRKQQFASQIFGSDLLICLFAGSSNHCMAFTWDENRDRSVLLANHRTSQDFEFENNPPFDPDAGSGPAEGLVQPIGWSEDVNGRNIRFDNWRGVSYALHVNCCNNDEDNDGWWEAIRVQRNTFRHRFGLIIDRNRQPERPGQQAFYTETGYLKHYVPETFVGDACPAYMTVQEWYSARNWALNPSYQTGKLKNIQKVMFRLNQTQTLNEFQKMRPVPWDNTEAHSSQWQPQHHAVYNMDVNEAYPKVHVDTDEQYVSSLWVPFTELNQEALYNFNDDAPITIDALGENWAQNTYDISEWMKTSISEGFDMILIRVHGLDRTHLNLHSVQCTELMCSESNSYNTFMTSSYAARDQLERYIEYVQKNQKYPGTTVSKYYCLD